MLFLRQIVIRQGAQGIVDAASNQSIEEAFGTKKQEDAIIQILKEGQIQGSEVYTSCNSFLQSFGLPSPCCFCPMHSSYLKQQFNVKLSFNKTLFGR